MKSKFPFTYCSFLTGGGYGGGGGYNGGGYGGKYYFIVTVNSFISCQKSSQYYTH